MVVFFFPSQLCCPLRIKNSPQTHQWEGFLVFGNFSSFMTPSPGRISIPNTFVSLSIFYILSYLLSKTMGYLSGCMVSTTSIQKLYCGICSKFKWSFNEFLGEKVVSPSYSSTILGLPPPTTSEFSLCVCVYVSIIESCESESVTSKLTSVKVARSDEDTLRKILLMIWLDSGLVNLIIPKRMKR